MNYIEDKIKEFDEKFGNLEPMKELRISGTLDWHIKEFLHSALTGLGNEMTDIVTDEATGANCLTKKWKCCGYHDACENILKRMEKIYDYKPLK